MRTSKAFEDDLNKAYHGSITIDRLIKNHSEYIKGMARYALRYKTKWMESLEEDDLYQEACYWLVDSMWRWDDTKGITLAHYVVYNIGTRIQMFVLAERAKKRHPDKMASRVDVWGSRKREYGQATQGGSNRSNESEIANTSPSPADEYLAAEIVATARCKLSADAAKLVEAVLCSGGSYSAAVEILVDDVEIVRRHGTNRDHVAYVLKKTVPEIQKFLTDSYNLT